MKGKTFLLGVLVFVVLSNLKAQDSLHLHQSRVCSYFENTYEDTTVTIELFEGEDRAKLLIDKILEPVGLFGNFEIKQGDVPNAIALNKNKKRFIIYNKDFIDRVERRSTGRYPLTAILAHEVAHHLLGHTFERNDKRLEIELEADFWSGFILYKLGATLREAQQVIYKEAPHFPAGAYPGKEPRLLAIQEGWEKAREQDNVERRNFNSRREEFFDMAKPGNIDLPSLSLDSTYTLQSTDDLEILNPPLVSSLSMSSNDYTIPQETLEEWMPFIEQISTSPSINAININSSNSYSFTSTGNSTVTFGNKVYINVGGHINRDTILNYSAPTLAYLTLPQIVGFDNSLPIEIELIQGAQSVSIFAPKEISNSISFYVSRGIWHIGVKQGGVFDFSGVKLYLTLPTIKEIEISGNGRVTTNGMFLQSEPVKLEISGAGNISLNSIIQYLKCSISGAGNISLSGECQEMDVSISGAGNFDSLNFKVNNCNLNASGATNCNLNITDQFRVSLSGMSRVRYTGNPKILYESISPPASLMQF